MISISKISAISSNISFLDGGKGHPEDTASILCTLRFGVLTWLRRKSGPQRLFSRQKDKVDSIGKTPLLFFFSPIFLLSLLNAALVQSLSQFLLFLKTIGPVDE